MRTFNRTLNFRTTLAVVVGGVIGSGIFMKPALMASQLGSPLLLLTVWVLAGVITLFGALSTAEAAAMFPETGGQYVFFKKMYGEGFAFLYGWSAFAVFNTAGATSIAYVCAGYANYFLHLPRLDAAAEHSFALFLPGIGRFYPLENLGVKLLTIALIMAFTLINYRGVQHGAAVQRLLTVLKMAAIALLILGLLTSGKGSFQSLATDQPLAVLSLGAVMAAMSGAFWAYDGWNNITFIAGEIERPQQNIPRSLFLGLLICTAIYILVNLAYVYILPFDRLAASSFVASDAASVAWGVAGAALIAGLVVLSTLGATNANVLATARVTYALGKEYHPFRWAGSVHPRYQTPGNALLIQGVWSCLLALSGSFDQLTDMLIFVSWVFYGASALGVLVLRKKYKDHPRPYKVPGYPLTPVIFVGFTLCYLLITLYTDIANYNSGKAPVINSVWGCCITLIGIPLYFWARKRKDVKAEVREIEKV